MSIQAWNRFVSLYTPYIFSLARRADVQREQASVERQLVVVAEDDVGAFRLMSLSELGQRHARLDE